MIKPILASLIALGSTASQATLYDYSTTNKIYPTQVVKETVVVNQKTTPVVQVQEHPLDVSVYYRNDKAIDLEGVEASVQYQLNDKVVLGGNI